MPTAASGPRRFHHDAARGVRCARVAPLLFRARGTPRGLPPSPFPRCPIGAPTPTGPRAPRELVRGCRRVLRDAHRGVVIDELQDGYVRVVFSSPRAILRRTVL